MERTVRRDDLAALPLGLQLLVLRRLAGLRQHEAGAMLGVDQLEVSGFETRLRPVPDDLLNRAYKRLGGLPMRV